MKSHRRRQLTILFATALLAGCGGYEPPEEADPAESAEPLPNDTVLVPGAGEPGPQPDAANGGRY